VTAPNSRWRERVVAYRGADLSDSPALEAGASDAEGRAEADGERRYWTWAALMRRAFDIDVLACPRCGGRLRLLALIEDPRVIRQILEHLGHLGLPADVSGRAPPKVPETSDLHA
jgi:hypothetical protein